MQTAREHNRTEIIARRDGVDYVECLDCRQIFEADSIGLIIVVRQADLDPLPFAFIVRNRITANADSIGLIVRTCTQCPAGKS